MDGAGKCRSQWASIRTVSKCRPLSRFLAVEELDDASRGGTGLLQMRSVSGIGDQAPGARLDPERDGPGLGGELGVVRPGERQGRRVDDTE